MGETGNLSTLRTLYYPPLADLKIKPAQFRCGDQIILKMIPNMMNINPYKI